MDKKFYTRKTLRLQNFDYSENYAYFITICTEHRELLFGDVGADSISARMITEVWEETINQCAFVFCDNFVVMPNHFHAILRINRADMESAPTISQVIQSFKRNSTIKYIQGVKNGRFPPFNKRIWQRSFHDHIIRNDRDYLEIWQYIDNNPGKWTEDCYYKKTNKTIDK